MYITKKAPCYQSYPSDFFGDPFVRIMSPDARAFYRLLLDCIWDFDTQFSIPNDDNLISKLLCIDENRWLEMKKEIILSLCVVEDRLVSKRLYKEKVKQDKYRKAQSKNGKAGGRPRKSHGLSSVNPTESLPLPLPIPLPDKEKKIKKKPFPIPDDLTLTEKHIAYAIGKEIPEDFIPRMFEDFRDWHKSHGTEYTDWDATWQTWVRKQIDFGKIPINSKATSANEPHYMTSEEILG